MTPLDLRRMLRLVGRPPDEVDVEVRAYERRLARQADPYAMDETKRRFLCMLPFADPPLPARCPIRWIIGNATADLHRLRKSAAPTAQSVAAGAIRGWGPESSQSAWTFNYVEHSRGG